MRWVMAALLGGRESLRTRPARSAGAPLWRRERCADGFDLGQSRPAVRPIGLTSGKLMHFLHGLPGRFGSAMPTTLRPHAAAHAPALRQNAAASAAHRRGDEELRASDVAAAARAALRSRRQGTRIVAPTVPRASSAMCAPAASCSANRLPRLADDLAGSHQAEHVVGHRREFGARRRVGEQRRPGREQRTLLRQQPDVERRHRPRGGCRSCTNMPRGCRQSSEAGKVSLPTES